VDKTFYSVPHQLIGRRVEVRLTHRMIEIFHAHQRVASHVRRSQRAGHVTVNEHMLKAHQRYANMTPANLIQRAARIGPNAATLVERAMRARPHPEQGYRSAMGIIALARPMSVIGWKRPASGRLPSMRSATPRSALSSNPGSIAPARLSNLSEPRPCTPTSGAGPTINKEPLMLTNPMLEQTQALRNGDGLSAIGRAGPYRRRSAATNGSD
jgi:hypothetical protein